MLWVDGRAGRQGPVVNTAVISAAAPSYAPAGRHLIQGSALIGRDHPEPTASQMRRHAAAILGTDAADWQPVSCVMSFRMCRFLRSFRRWSFAGPSAPLGGLDVR